MKKLVMLLFIAFSSVCTAQTVAFDNTNTIYHATGTSVSHSFTVTPVSNNLVAIALVGWDDNGAGHSSLSITSITLGGNAMTSCGAAISVTTSGYYTFAQAFYLVNPPTGSQTLAVTASTGTYEIFENVSTYTGVNQTTPIRPNTYTTKVNNATSGSGGPTSVLVPSQVGDLVFGLYGSANSTYPSSSLTNDGQAGNISYFGSGHATVSGPTVLSSWYGSAVNNYTAVLGFSLQPPNNTAVISAIGGISVGQVTGNITQVGGNLFGSAVSGNFSSVGSLASPANTTSINLFFNPGNPACSSNCPVTGVVPTTTTLANSTTGDLGYLTSWYIAELGNGMTYTASGSPPAMLNPVSDNSGTTNTTAGSKGLVCVTGSSVHCGLIYLGDNNLGASTSMGIWFYSTCVGTGSQDCGSGPGMQNAPSSDGFALHVEAGLCSYNGWSIDPGTYSSCLTGLYSPSTWYRLNSQLNAGEANFTATFSTSTPVIAATQTLAVNQAVTVANTGGSLPGGYSAATPYYVLSTGLSGSGFELAKSQNGTPIQATSTGSGTNTFQVINQASVCTSNGTFVGTLYIPAGTSDSTFANEMIIGFGGEEPQVSGFTYYYYGSVLDGTGKFSNTGCVI